MAKNSLKLRFRISGIEVFQFATIDIGEVLEDELIVDSEFGFGLDHEKSLLVCKYKCQFSYKEKTFIIIEIACFYEIESTSLKKQKVKNERKYKLPMSFSKNIAEITVSTARGILFEKTENNRYRKFILPLIDLNDALKEDIEIEY